MNTNKNTFFLFFSEKVYLSCLCHFLHFKEFFMIKFTWKSFSNLLDQRIQVKYLKYLCILSCHLAFCHLKKSLEIRFLKSPAYLVYLIFKDKTLVLKRKLSHWGKSRTLSFCQEWVKNLSHAYQDRLLCCQVVTMTFKFAQFFFFST